MMQRDAIRSMGTYPLQSRPPCFGVLAAPAFEVAMVLVGITPLPETGEAHLRIEQVHHRFSHQLQKTRDIVHLDGRRMEGVHPLVPEQLLVQQIAHIDQLLLLGGEAGDARLQLQVGLLQFFDAELGGQFDRIGRSHHR